MINDIFSLSTDYTVTLNILSIIIIWYIMIFMPEATLVSKIQLLRASKLYHKLQYMKSDEEEDDKLLLVYDAPRLINNYLKSIPQEIWDDLHDHS